MFLQKILNQKTTPDNIGPRYIQAPLKKAGIIVTHDTALQASAVFACIRVIAEDIASLPWQVFTRKPDGGRERASNSPVEHVLNRRPNPEMSAFAFRETMIAWALTWGNGYAEITRDMANRPTGLYPIAPDRVEVKRDKEGKLVYEVNNVSGPKTYLDAKNVFHLHGIGFDGLVGYSMISLAARSIGLSISLEEFGAQFFGNGATLGGVLQIPEGSTMSDPAKVNMRDTFNKKHQGPYNAHNVEILDGGVEYKEIGIAPNKGQFTQTRQNQVEEICRWFRVSPQKIAHLLRMTFNNVEQLSIDHVQDTLVPWITRLEQEADFKLFSANNTKQYTKINANALLRGDIAARSTFYKDMWNLAVLSVNEIREFEDMNPVKDGDKRFVQLNMTTLEKAGEDPPEVIPDEPTTEDNMEDVIEDRIKSILMLEDNRFNGMKDRYTDRQEYIDRVCGHLGSQRTNVAKDIKALLTIALDKMGVEPDQVNDAARQYSDLHFEMSRVYAIKLYDGVEQQSIDERAKFITRKLMDSAVLYARNSYAGN